MMKEVVFILGFCYTLTALNIFKFRGNVEQQKIGALECVLKYYEIYMNDSDFHSASRLQINFDKNRNQFISENQFLKMLNENNVKASLIIDTARNMNSADRIPTKTSKYTLFASTQNQIEENILKWKNEDSWNPFASVFIVVDAKNIDRDGVMGIFETLHKHDMMKCLVVHVNEPNGYVDMLSWFPYDKNSEFCGRKVENIESLGRCSFGTHSPAIQVNNIRRKYRKWESKWSLNNLNKCPIHVLLYPVKPFASVVNVTIKGNEEQFFSGAEIHVIQLLAWKLNSKSKLIAIDNGCNQSLSSMIKHSRKIIFQR